MKKKTKSAGKIEQSVKPIKLDTGHLHQTMAYHIRRAQLQLWRDFKENVNSGTLIRGQYTVMSMIDANPGITQIDLSRELDIDKASLVTLIYRLEKTGWITKTPAKEDRRRHALSLTKEGQKNLNKLNENMELHEKEMRSKFTTTEVETLIKLLQRIYEQ